MKQVTIKIIAVFLSLLSVLGCFPLSVFAAESTAEPIYSDTEQTPPVSETPAELVSLFYNKITLDYVANGSYQSGRVSQYVSEIGKTSSSTTSTAYSYTYDANGNITSVSENGVLKYQYHYDSLGQLVREDNAAINKSYAYEYDAAGNILSKKTYAFTTAETLGAVQSTVNYTYGNTSWGDQLTQFNGTDIVYDGIGNPLQIGNAQTGSRDIQLIWNGRELESYELREAAGVDEYGDLYFDTTTYSFTYNKDGIRTSKTVNGVISAGQTLISKVVGSYK